MTDLALSQQEEQEEQQDVALHGRKSQHELIRSPRRDARGCSSMRRSEKEEGREEKWSRRAREGRRRCRKAETLWRGNGMEEEEVEISASWAQYTRICA